jgi:integrase
MISIRFSLRDKKSKIKSTIRTSVSYKGQRIVFCPGYSINPQHWDFKYGLPRSIKGNVELNSVTNHLKELELNIRRLYTELEGNGSNIVYPDVFQEKIKRIIHPDKKDEGDHSKYLIDFVNLFIEESKTGKRLKDSEYKIEGATIKVYRSTKNHLMGFQEKMKRKILLKDINQKFHDDFSDYLSLSQNLSKNTHSKYMTILQQILKNSVKKKFIPSQVISEIEFNTTKEESDNIFLDEKELQVLMNFKDFKSDLEEHVRDIFVLGCYTGLRFSNYSNLNLDHINGDILTIVQLKTKHKISIPIHPFVKMIIDKYNGVLPKCPTNQEFNRTLKDIGKRIPEFQIPFIKQVTRKRTKQVEETLKWEMITTHTARRSFCTNMYLLGIPVMTIMSISGHKTEKSFRTYIKASSHEHAVLMKNYWEKQNSGSPLLSAHDSVHG